MTTSSARRRGFTLVEVMVALLIMAVLATLAWQGVEGIVRARDSSQERLEQASRLNTVIAQWDQDLNSIYDSPVVPGLEFDGATVRLARVVPGGVQMVAWSLQGRRWQRWTGPVVTRSAELQASWMLSRQLLGNEPQQLLLLDGVTEVQLEFFRKSDNGWTNPQSTGDLAPSGPGAAAPQRSGLPAGVRLRLALGEQRLVRDLLLTPSLP